MKDRIKVWSPKGGDGIEVYAADAGRLVMNGWTTVEPKVVEAAAETDEIETEEGFDYGNN